MQNSILFPNSALLFDITLSPQIVPPESASILSPSARHLGRLLLAALLLGLSLESLAHLVGSPEGLNSGRRLDQDGKLSLGTLPLIPGHTPLLHDGGVLLLQGGEAFLELLQLLLLFRVDQVDLLVLVLCGVNDWSLRRVV